MENNMDIESIISKLKASMDFNWLYKDPELDLKTLAAHLGVSYGVLSKAIKSHHGVGFRVYVNQVRVDRLIEKIKKINTKLSVEESMEISGFRSRVTFFNAFKTRTGMNFTTYCNTNIAQRNDLPIFDVVDDRT